MYWEVTAQDAWGKTAPETYLDGTTGVLANYDSSGQARTASCSLHGSVVDSLTYSYDGLDNLLTQKRGTANSARNTETYSYDALQRLTSASRSGGTVNYGYSPAGNLRYKDDYSTKPGAAPWAYQYGTQVGSSSGACGPHGAMSVALAGSGTASYQCDAIGNVIGGSTLSATYDADNHPRTVTRSGIGSTGWAYGADGERDYESSSEGARYFGASGYEQVGNKQIHELGPIILTSTGGTITGITIALRDRLGSTIDTIDNGAATIANARTYDAFGAVRDGNMNTRPGGTLNLGDTKHGFTQHEHADDVRLIHMGGRIYDYTLGRFLNVDPVIGNPLSSQSLNPYSYIGNNPLSGKDPTGYVACGTVSSDQTSSSGSCDLAGKDGKTTSVNYAFNSNGDVAVGKNASQVSAAVSIGVLQSNGAVGMSSAGAGGVKNTQADASSQMSLGNTPNTPSGQLSPTGSSTATNSQYPEHEKPLTEPMDEVLKMHPLIGAADAVANCMTGGCSATGLLMAGIGIVVPELKMLGKVKSAGQLGREGETAVREAIDIGEKTKIAVNGRNRIPDGLTRETLSEVKNVETLSYTRQLRDYSEYAQANGLRFDLYTRPSSRLSGPLQDAIDKGLVNRLDIPK